MNLADLGATQSKHANDPAKAKNPSSAKNATEAFQKFLASGQNLNPSSKVDAGSANQIASLNKLMANRPDFSHRAEPVREDMTASAPKKEIAAKEKPKMDEKDLDAPAPRKDKRANNDNHNDNEKGEFVEDRSQTDEDDTQGYIEAKAHVQNDNARQETKSVNPIKEVADLAAKTDGNNRTAATGQDSKRVDVTLETELEQSARRAMEFSDKAAKAAQAKNSAADSATQGTELQKKLRENGIVQLAAHRQPGVGETKPQTSTEQTNSFLARQQVFGQVEADDKSSIELLPSKPDKAASSNQGPNLTQLAMQNLAKAAGGAGSTATNGVEPTSTQNSQLGQLKTDPTKQLAKAPEQSAAKPLPKQTQQSIANQLARHAKPGESRFEIRLDPAELGRIDVKMRVGDDGSVRAHLIVEKPETLEMMMRDRTGLERTLEQAGLKADPGNLQFSLKQDGNQSFAELADREQGQGSKARADTEAEDDDAPQEAIDANIDGLDVSV